MTAGGSAKASRQNMEHILLKTILIALAAGFAFRAPVRAQGLDPSGPTVTERRNWPMDGDISPPLIAAQAEGEYRRLPRISLLSTAVASDPPSLQEVSLVWHSKPDLNSSPSGIWAHDAVGEDFRPGLQEAGFALGGAVGVKGLGGIQAHDLALGALHYGWVFSDVVGKDAWYRGNWEFVAELFGGAQFHPRHAYVVGATPVLRYNFATGTRWVPFFDAGLGPSATDIGHPDLGSTFEFNLQAGPGVRFFWRKDVALTFQSRFLHLSNGGIKTPNQGVNTVTFSTGITWFF